MKTVDNFIQFFLLLGKNIPGDGLAEDGGQRPLDGARQ